MSLIFAFGRDLGKSLSQGLHCSQGVIIAQHLRWERPDVSQRHGTEAASRLPTGAFDDRMHIEKRDAIDGHAAEFERRAIMKVLVIKGNIANADVGGFTGHAWPFIMELESIYSMQKSKPRLAIELSAGIGWNG